MKKRVVRKRRMALVAVSALLVILLFVLAVMVFEVIFGVCSYIPISLRIAYITGYGFFKSIQLIVRGMG